MSSESRTRAPGHPAALPAPASGGALHPVRHVAIPEWRALQDLRHALARGARPRIEKRTPEDDVRIVTFHAVSLLLPLLQRFKQRIEAGERCHIVARKHPWKCDRIVIEIVIESDDAGRHA